MKQHSKINAANRNGTSLKATIPKAIAEVLELEVGEDLTWTVNVLEGQKVITVKKRESSDD